MSENNKNLKQKNTNEGGEDSTKYGEFVSSFFAWIPLPEQKEKVNKLEKITKDKKD